MDGLSEQNIVEMKSHFDGAEGGVGSSNAGYLDTDQIQKAISTLHKTHPHKYQVHPILPAQFYCCTAAFRCVRAAACGWSHAWLRFGFHGLFIGDDRTRSRVFHIILYRLRRSSKGDQFLRVSSRAAASDSLVLRVVFSADSSI